jgi:hypothetical protein
MALTLEVPEANGNGAAQTFRGGWATIYYTGTFDSGTASLQVSDDGGDNYVAVLDEFGNAIAPAENAYRSFHLAGPTLLRNVLSGSSGSTAVTCHVRTGIAGVKTGESP